MNYLITFFKGMAMGAADVVPGVSGGTIAFITGIYDKLLGSIRSINPSLLTTLKQQGVKGAWQSINGTFLVALFTGVLTSIATLAKLISWLMVTHPIPLWSFFFGLILVSVYHILRQVKQRDVKAVAFLLIGVGFAYLITVLKPLDLEPTTFNFFLCGTIAICAMILPGISGSFILLLLGMYTPVLAAVKGADFALLGLFLAGCVSGLLCFSHLLSWLLNRYRDLTLTFLTGLMIGTLPKIWPWKETISWRTNSSGEQVPLEQINLSPFSFEAVANQPAQLAYAIIAALFAIGLVLLLEKVADNH
ncbi:DUF368 domain-containing protein [Vibrio sp. WXL103]|uniref:DUF368 domain-containing protein n=1 Tax=Vibrio sp. WXL103 TaxID=3450710 RepID=UPI003EC8C18B